MITVTKNTTPVIGSPASIIAYAGNASVTVTWSDVVGVDSYRIYRSSSSPVTKVTGSLIVSGLTTTAYIDTDVTNGTPYYYVMTSVKGTDESAESAQVSAIPGSTGVIQGTIRYEDKEYGSTGFTGNTYWKTVRYAAVEVISTSAPAGPPLYTTQTDSRGNYSIVSLPSATQVYIRVNSTAVPPSSGAINVKNLANKFYGVPSDPFPLSGSAFVNISISVSNIAGAFNILDVMTTGYEFIRNYDDGSAYPGVSLATFWEPGNGLGTFFCTGVDCPPSTGNGIYVYSDPNADTDENDDDVLWHEFGHFMAATYSMDQSQGGAHYLTDNDHDLRFSWSEGWGDFLPGAIKAWLAESDPSRLSTPPGQSISLYTDTSGGSGWSFDFGLAPSIPAYYYSSGEVAVANVLLRLRSGISMKDIWDVFVSFKTVLAVTPSRPANLELFWDQWALMSKPTTSGSVNVQTVFENRQILYRADGNEDDDTLATAWTATNGFSSNHTLYSDGDMDFVKFTPLPNTSYSIRTNTLRNGADTFLVLYDAASNTISTNDNSNNTTYVTTPFNCSPVTLVCHENGNDILGSLISFTSPTVVSGHYMIRVSSSPTKPDSAGRYGTYNLIVTSP